MRAEPLGAAPASPRRPRVAPLRVQDERTYEALKRAAIQRAQRSGALPDGLQPRAAPRTTIFAGILNAPGLRAEDNSQFNDGTPPDTTGAIGPNAYVEFVNTVVSEYSRDNLALVGSPVQGDTFMGVTGRVTFDIQMQWDQQGGRWFYLADDCGSDFNCSTANRLDFGWSKTADPAGMNPGQWCHYAVSSGSFQGHALFDDYPKLGHDNSQLIFGTNVFGGAQGTTFETARIWSIPKPASGDIGSCPAPGTATAFGSPTTPLLLSSPNSHEASTPVPVNAGDSLAQGYVVAADDPTNPAATGAKDQLMAWHVTNGSPPTLVADGLMTVASYDVPAPAPQSGNSVNTLDTLDARLTQAVALAEPAAGGQEAVWTQHTVDSASGRSVDRWYELIPSSLTVRQEGTIDSATDFIFNGAVSPSADGKGAAIQYNASSSTLDPEIRAQSRRATDTLDEMSGEVTLATSAAPDHDFSCEPAFGGPPCRWGDYAGVTPDPLETGVVWGSNQTSGAAASLLDDNPHWQTRNFALLTHADASFTVTPNPALSGQTVTFDGSRSGSPGSSIVHYEWDLDGDGTFETDSGTNPVVSRAYPAAGSVAVNLRVTDGTGEMAQATRTLVVSNPPLPPPPVLVPPQPTPDTTPPILKLTFKKVQKLRVVLRRGVAGNANCNETCTARFQLQLPRTVAKRLHIAARFVTVGKLTKRIGANRTLAVRIKLSRKARKRLAHVRRVRLRVSVLATDASGNRDKTPVVRSVTVKR
jgi:hypothetical protein